MLKISVDWQNFYNTVRDPAWPKKIRFDQINNLPDEVKNELVLNHLLKCIYDEEETDNKKNLKILADSKLQVDELCNNQIVEDNIKTNEWHLIELNDIIVHYTSEMIAGGIERQDYFVRSIKHFYPNKKFNNCLEWCSGAGFIGFSLLGAGICEHLVFADKYKPALDACEKTILTVPTELQEKIQTRHINKISQLPLEDKFDLVVANPPWFPVNLLTHSSGQRRLAVDPGFDIHKEFFKNIKKHLSLNGIIVLIEGINCTGPLDFKQMIESNGLVITKVFTFTNTNSYMMVITHS
jgi:tRNA1(Val) A37 N6-methylase TrmN6